LPDPEKPQETPAAPAAAPAADVAALQAEIAALRARAEQAEDATRFWAEKAKTPTATPAAAPTDKTDAEDVDLLAAIAQKGAKAIDEYLTKRGYIPADQVQERVNKTVAETVLRVSKEAELTGRYEGLKDKNSEFFKQTAAIFRQLKEGGVADHIAMELAADKAELERLRKESEVNRSKEKRTARAAAQAPEKTAGAPAGGGEDEQEELTQAQKDICAWMGISEDAYKARAKQGVKIGGIRK
jgi:hypothetical protein